MLEKPHGWQKTAIALGAAAAFGLGTLSAQALTLGSTVILSQQGEPLRAAIELPQISNEEAASLQATLAPADVFRASGLNYSAGLEGMQITLQRGDGRAYLQLRGKAPLQQAFVDLLVEVQWASGRILRAYTLLLEAPPQPATVTPPAPAASAEAPAAPAAVPTTTTTPPPSPAPAAPTVPRRTVLVKYGDTAGAIASAHALADATQEQMLVALLRGNPQAFVNNNVNRLRSGVELTLPDSAQAQATPAPEARRIIQAQYREFNDYRRQLAEGAAQAKVQAAKRKDKGSIEAPPAPPKAPAGPADKLTLSKGAAQDKAVEDELSKRRDQKEADERAAELEKNLAELRKLSAELSQQASAPAAAASEPASSPLPAVAAAQPASAPVQAASEPASAPPAAATLPVAEPPAKGSALLDTLLDNPLLPALAGSLVTLLAALGLARIRQRRAGPENKALAEAAEIPAFIPPQPPEPAPTPTTPAPVTPAPQPEPAPEPEAPREVDPVAEADVYLAYGREEQAVAVLREGLLNQPERLAIHMKLLEIYAKQLNTQPFEEIALQVQQLSGGAGDDWERACEWGRTIDPYNALYQPPGEEAPAEEPAQTSDDDWAAALAEASAPPPAPEPARSELDLDLGQAVSPAAPPAEELGSDLELDSPPEEAPAEPPALTIEEPPRPAQPASAPLDFDLGSINLDLGTSSQEPPPPPSEDPLAVKLALAEEFTAIGDTDGARSLLEEVLAEASGDVRAKAEAALQKLQ